MGDRQIRSNYSGDSRIILESWHECVRGVIRAVICDTHSVQLYLHVTLEKVTIHVALERDSNSSHQL